MNNASLATWLKGSEQIVVSNPKTQASYRLQTTTIQRTHTRKPNSNFLHVLISFYLLIRKWYKPTLQKGLAPWVSWCQTEGKRVANHILRDPRNIKHFRVRNSLAVQWLGLCTSTAGNLSSIPDQGTKSLEDAWLSQKQQQKNISESNLNSKSSSGKHDPWLQQGSSLWPRWEKRYLINHSSLVLPVWGQQLCFPQDVIPLLSSLPWAPLYSLHASLKHHHWQGWATENNRWPHSLHILMPALNYLYCWIIERGE